MEKVGSLAIPNWQTEIIAVDDFSTDGARIILHEYQNKYKVIYHHKNRGKGSAVKSGIEQSTGDYIVIQDADLEYNPNEIPRLIAALDGKENRVVYGSRNINTKDRKMMLLPRLGIWFITKEFNILFGAKLTDLWTCYKLFPREASGFFPAGKFESELSFSARLIRNGFEIIEVEISHNPRSFSEGKKIGYMDGIKGILTVFKEYFRN